MKTETLEPIEASVPATGPSGEITESRPTAIQLKNILVPLDFSEMSFKSLQYAVPFAKQFGARLTLLHVVAPTDYQLDFSYPVPLEEKRMAEIEKQLEDIRVAKVPPDVTVVSIVRQSRPFTAILEVARETQADLIIAGTRGFTGLDHVLLGSTAEKVVRKAPCPVLVLHASQRDFV
jgi:nucleotide-binding universal stress UspA family protein